MSRQPPQPERPAEPELWEALARYVAGESSAAEADEVRRWLAQEPARAEMLGALDRATRRLAFSAPADLDVEGALRAVTSRLGEPQVTPIRRPVTGRERRRFGWSRVSLRVAAALTLAAGAAVVWWATTHDRDPQRTVAIAAQTFETRMGQTDSVRLPDGSQVVLGPGSRLTVMAGYGVASRLVELSGLAHFDVTHDEASPFMVRAGRATIRDLGTTFMVRGDDGAEVSVLVTSGSVVLHAADAAEEQGVVLQAGDRGLLGRDGQAVAERASVSEDDVAWTRGRLVFREASLPEVSVELRRWYGVELRLADTSFAGRHLTATFEGESVQQVLDVIGIALGARIETRGDTAFLSALPAEPPR